MRPPRGRLAAYAFRTGKQRCSLQRLSRSIRRPESFGSKSFTFQLERPSRVWRGGRAYTSAKLIAQMRMPAVYEDAIGDEEKSMDEWSKAARESMQVDGEGGEGEQLRFWNACGAVACDGDHIAGWKAAGTGSRCALAALPFAACGRAPRTYKVKLQSCSSTSPSCSGERSEFVQEVGSRGLGPRVRDVWGRQGARRACGDAGQGADVGRRWRRRARGKGGERDEQVFRGGHAQDRRQSAR